MRGERADKPEARVGDFSAMLRTSRPVTLSQRASASSLAINGRKSCPSVRYGLSRLVQISRYLANTTPTIHSTLATLGSRRD